MEVLGYIVLLLLGVTLAKNNLLYQNILTSSRNLHNTLITKLARSKVEFFDKNTSGHIMGRCSKDIAMMDDFLSWMFTDFIQVMFLAFGSMAAMVIGNPWLCIVIIPVILGIVFVMKRGVGPTR